MAFDAPFLLWVAPGVGVVLAGLALWARAARVARAAKWSAELGAQAAALGRLTPLVVGVAALLATIAVANPRWGSRTVVTETKGLNLVIAVDISRSMLAEDVRPSRLERARRLAARLVHDLPGDRIGLIAFAGQSFILSPLTVDASALQLLIDALDPNLTSAGGSELSGALRIGRELLFVGDKIADRVLVVVTDGEAHDSVASIVTEAQRLRREGVRLLLVAEGSREPARIPVRDTSGALVGYQRDPGGEIVETRRRDDVLAATADAAQGLVVAAELEDQAGAVREMVAAFKRMPQATSTAEQDISRAWVPLLVAVALLLGQTVTRRSMALAGAALALVGGGPLQAQAPRRLAEEAWGRGEFRVAAERYLAELRSGAGGDTSWFNFGTAALAIGDTGAARQALQRAAASLDPDLRFRALYNLGLLHLRRGRADSANAAGHFDAARGRFREALLLFPNDMAAKWNLELAIRHSPPASGGGAPQGGGAGGGGGAPPPPSGGLSLAQAEQLLNSMSEEERRTRLEQVRRRHETRDSRGRRDW